MTDLQSKIIFGLLAVLLVPISCVSSEAFYIVTSSKSHCPREFIGEPCITLKQYASHRYPHQSSSTVTLTVESGNHFLQDTRLQLGWYSRRISFIMIAEHPGAKIIYTSTSSRESFIYNYIYAQYIQINGITFVGSFVHIMVSNAQEVVINNCSFQGASFGLSWVTNATLLRCAFSDFRRYHHNGIIIYGQDGALSILYSTVVKIFQSNFTNNEAALYGFNDYYEGMQSVHIQESIFLNNTPRYGESAVYFAGDYTSIIISVYQSIFINNTESQSGGAIFIDVKQLDFSILTESSFIHNSADSCGALSITKHYDTNIIQITDSVFELNRALNVSNVGGGAVCIVNTPAIISNCTFTGNTAIGYGGAIVFHDSAVVIDHTDFNSNMAGLDGGALITYARPSNYTISQSSFIYNQAGDDGGAMFIGRRGSNVRLEMCTFSNNLAIARGGAITIFGSTLEINGTTIENNRAAFGEKFSSCSSNVVSSINGYRDINCSYDGPTTNYFNTTKSLKGPSFSNITLDVTIGDFCTEHQPEEPTTNEVNKVASAAYASLTISAIIILTFLLYFLIEKLVRSKIKCMSSLITTQSSTQLRSEPLYAEAAAKAIDNMEIIEMKPNVLYGKCELQNQAQPQEVTSS